MRDLDIALLDALSEIAPDPEEEPAAEEPAAVADTRAAEEPEETEEPEEPVTKKGGKK